MDEDIKLVIVKSNTKNLTALPDIATLQPLIVAYNRKYYTKNRKSSLSKTYGKCMYLLYGINYIPREYWEKAKQHLMVKMMLKNSLLEEIINDEDGRKLEVAEKKKIDIKSRIDDIEINKMSDIESKIKDLQKNLENAKDEKQKEKIKSDLLKTEGKKEAYIEDKETLSKELKEADELLEKYESGEKLYKTLSIKKRKKILDETFDLRTLKYFEDEESDPAVRLIIQKKIDNTLSEHVETENPKSHVKVT